MKKYILILLCLSYFPHTYGQVIKGILLEEKTNEAIPFANVYYDQTFQGTIADENGNFKLEELKDSTIPLVVSAIGYYSATISDYSNNENLKIYLKPKVYKLSDVIIRAKSLERKRKRYLRLFRQEFLGTTANAKKCVILNENDIAFTYDSDDDTIQAHALKPILIENKALGYRIAYYLDKFEYVNSSHTIFRGNCIFIEHYSENNESAKLLNKKRESTYSGSRMHFIRTLHLDSIAASGFRVKNGDNDKLAISDFVINTDKNQRFLKNIGDINISYKAHISSIEFTGDSIYINDKGFFDPIGIYWKGDMALQRMADWLPYEYFPDE